MNYACAKSWLTYTLATAMVALAYPYTKEWVLFSLHIIFMAFFIWATLTATILLQRNDNESKTQPERKRNVNYHALLQILACIAACVGFWAVNQNKTNKGKTHWESWHGVIGLLTFILIVVVSVLGSAMRFFPVASFGSLVKCRCWLDFKRYSGVVVILLTLYVTGTGLLERSVMQRFPMWQRYSIFCVVLSATGFCLWNCVFEYAIKGIACLRRRGPAYEELA